MPRPAPTGSFVNTLYHLARVANDIHYAEKGPVPYAKRRARARVYRVEGRYTRKAFKAIGL